MRLAALPNLRVKSILNGPGDTMRVTVINDGGDASHGAYLDLFVGWQLIPPYAIGGVAMFWVIERVAGF